MPSTTTMNKHEKATLINAAIARSESAMKQNYRAEVRDGKLVYLYERKSAMGHGTTCRANYRDVLHVLNGADIRTLEATLKNKPLIT